MQAQTRSHVKHSHISQKAPPYAPRKERRQRSRTERDTEIVGRFTPGRIPVLHRQTGIENLNRLVDVLGSIVGLVLFAPILLFSIIAIKLSSPGPAFFVQIRVGAGGRLFRMYKLRTMVMNAEKMQAQLQKQNEMTGPAFKMKRDPRVFPVGRILRKLSIDEMPQFVNVLKGEMSLVGPRPPLPKEVKRYQRWQLQRLMIKPGLTGLWQVSGRNRLNFEEWVRLDIRYIRKRNFWVNFKIMLKTLKVAFIKPDGA